MSGRPQPRMVAASVAAACTVIALVWGFTIRADGQDDTGGLNVEQQEQSTDGVVPPRRETQVAESPERIAEGLLVLYEFQEGSGSAIDDQSDNGLHLEASKSLEWRDNQVGLVEPTILASTEPASALSEHVRASGEITVEAWVQPIDLQQQGPARILTISSSIDKRNLTLGQNGAGLEVRLRSDGTSTNALPASLAVDDVLGDARLQQVVYTRAAGGYSKLYVDGQVVAQGGFEGDLYVWDLSFHLALGDEFGGGGRPWIGSYGLVAIYGRSLSGSEVRQNYDASSEQLGLPRSSVHAETGAAGLAERDGEAQRESVDLSEWPDGSSTGWRGAGLLEGDLVAGDPIVVTENGAVIEGVDIVAPSGRGVAIEVRADDVTVRNCRLRGGGEESGPIVIMPGYRGLVVEFCELIGHGYETANLVKGSNMTLRRNNIYNGRNGPRLGNNVVLEENYIHGLVVSGDSHNDGTQSGGGCDVTIRGNHIHNEHDQTSAVNLGGTWKDPCLTGYTVERNLLRGGGYTLYFSADADTGMVRDNVFTREHEWGPVHLSARAAAWEGNRYNDGEPVLCPAC